MDIYHNESIHSHSEHGDKLTPLLVKHTFFWEEQEIFLPAIYVGKAGTVLDLCTKIPINEMKTFLQKWDKKRRLSLKTQEDYAQIEAENPAARDFSAEISLDDTLLTLSMSSSLFWYPPSILQWLADEADDASSKEVNNNNYAKELTEAYHLDKTCLWRISRHSFNWNDEPILTPQNMSLTLRADTIYMTAGHFTTNVSDNPQDNKTIKVLHPLNGEEYTLTLHKCEQVQVSMDSTTERNLIYPQHHLKLSYSILPKISRAMFDIVDCDESKPAKIIDTDENTSSTNGPTAIFLAGKPANPQLQTAVSSLHFAPVTTVRWRIVFHIKPKEDVCINLPMP